MRLAKMPVIISTLILVVGILMIAHAQKAEGVRFQITVNYGQNLDQMIKAGHYDYVKYQEQTAVCFSWLQANHKGWK